MRPRSCRPYLLKSRTAPLDCLPMAAPLTFFQASQTERQDWKNLKKSMVKFSYLWMFQIRRFWSIWFWFWLDFGINQQSILIWQWNKVVFHCQTKNFFSCSKDKEVATGQYVSKVIYGVPDSPKKWMKKIRHEVS